MSTAVHVYCGPTITAGQVSRILPGAVIHPPVRHGDLLAESLAPGDTVIIIDGVFFQAPPVRHKEILHLLAGGVRVAGAASMGALRAAELHQYGMIGIGKIFAAYRDGVITADDEVAVAHTPDGYAPLSEAMADIRFNLERATAAGVISDREARHLAVQLKAVHYPSRTWAMMYAKAAPDLQPAAGRLRQWAAQNGGFRSQKTDDARQALEMAASGTLPPARPGSWAHGDWENIFLRDWLARFRGTMTHGVHIPLELVLRHQQIHDPGFPHRWRRFVLSQMPGGQQQQDGTGAISAAEAAGISVRHLRPEQVAYWLTETEAATLTQREKLARILVRSVTHDMTAPIWPASRAEAGDLINPAMKSDEAVAAALRVNKAIAALGPQRTIWHLRENLIREYLAEVWGIRQAGEHLTAAARDRGFASEAAAINEARLFYLLSSAEAAKITAQA